MTEALKKTCISVLSSAAIFSSLTPVQTDFLLDGFAEVRSFAKDEVVYSRTHPEACIGVFLKGEARVHKDHVTVSVLQKGDQFGTVVLYNSAECFVNTIVAKSACKVLFLKKEGIDKLLSKSHAFAVAYIAYLSERVYFLNQKIEAYTAPSAEDRLLCYLKSACAQNATLENVSVTELSRQINVSRAGIYRALDSLSARGVLRYADKKVILLQEENV